MVEISKGTKQPIYQLPTEVISALGGDNITDGQRGKLAEIAKAAGENADAVMRYGLPAVIEALGGKITEEQLEQLGGRLSRISVAYRDQATEIMQQVVPALLKLQVAKFPDSSVDEFLEGLENYNQQAETKVAAAVQVVLRLFELTFNKDQDFETPKNEFINRIVEWYNKELPAAMNVTDKAFRAKRKGDGASWRVIRTKQLNVDLYQKVQKDFIEFNRETALSSLWQIAKIDPPTVTPRSEAESAAVLDALKGLSGDSVCHAIYGLRGVLPGLSGVPIRNPGGHLSPEAKTQELFRSIVENFEGHIPEWLRTNGVAFNDETKKTVDNFLHSLKGELGKLRKSGEHQELQVQLVGTKGIYDAFYDAIGENCAGNYGFALAESHFQPIRLIDPATQEHIGVVYALKGKVQGNGALVLAGVEIRKRYAYSLSSTARFIGDLVQQLSEVAKENGLRGGVWSTVGPAGDKGLWSDDGRIGQYSLIREGVVQQGMKHHGESAFVRLPEEEQIIFPPQFGKKIYRLVKLSSDQANAA